jgi:hypothetical protein
MNINRLIKLPFSCPCRSVGERSEVVRLGKGRFGRCNYFLLYRFPWTYGKNFTTIGHYKNALIVFLPLLNWFHSIFVKFFHRIFKIKMASTPYSFILVFIYLFLPITHHVLGWYIKNGYSHPTLVLSFYHVLSAFPICSHQVPRWFPTMFPSVFPKVPSVSQAVLNSTTLYPKNCFTQKLYSLTSSIARAKVRWHDLLFGGVTKSVNALFVMG